MHLSTSTSEVHAAGDMSHFSMPLEADKPRSRSMCRAVPSPNVLSYGHDMMLLHSRKCLLQLAGCLSDTVTEVDQYEARLLQSSPGVIILCQTLLREECRHACAFAMEHTPESQLLLLVIRNQRCFPTQHHTLLYSTVGPKIFSQTVFDLLYRDRFNTQ